MNTYLLTWNSNRWKWEDLPQQANQSATEEVIRKRWSCGQTKKIRTGDRVFLIHLGMEPKGIMAAGWTTSEPFQAEHWDEIRADAGQQALYVDCEWERLLNPKVDAPFPLSELKTGKLGTFNWTPQGSGIQIPKDVAEELERHWGQHVGCSTLGLVFADDEMRACEGEERLSLVRHRRREQKLREAKIRQALHAGNGRMRCEVPGCGFDFFEIYGDLGKDFAFVHHLKPLNERITPSATSLQDLVIVCGNCHAMIHRGGKCRSLEGLITTKE